MSLVSYNGVTLPYPYTTNFHQEAQYDEQGRTDWYCTKFDVSFSCIINTDYISVIDSTIPADVAPPMIMQHIRQKLLEPRKTLSVKFNDYELIPAKITGNAGTCDARNGPQPQSCKFTLLTNTTFIMEYRVVAHYWENNTVAAGGTVTNAAGNPVLYNRWTETVEINDCNFTTRTRDGKYVIRSDNSLGTLADDLRTQMAVVGVPPGFLRERSSYKIDPSGLGIQYTVVDREVFRKPPKPAFKASGYYSEQTTKFGAKRLGMVSLTLEGDKETKQSDLIDAAVILASKKIGARGAALGADKKGGFSVVEEASVKQFLFDNKIEFMMRVTMFPSKDIIGNRNVSLFVQMDDSVPTIDKEYTPPYLDRGTASMFLQAAKYFDPNLAENELGAGGQMSKGLIPGEAGKNAEE